MGTYIFLNLFWFFARSESISFNTKCYRCSVYITLYSSFLVYFILTYSKELPSDNIFKKPVTKKDKIMNFIISSIMLFPVLFFSMYYDSISTNNNVSSIRSSLKILIPILVLGSFCTGYLLAYIDRSKDNNTQV